MEIRKTADTTDNPENVERLLEAEHRLDILQSLVCDLLKTNQELRCALLEASSSEPDKLGSQHQTQTETGKPRMRCSQATL